MNTPELKVSVEPEPVPVKNDLPALWDLVIERIQTDGKARDEFGLKKYGTRLQPFNGRDALTDGFQELLDSMVYQYQAIFERQYEKPVIDSAIAFMELYLDENADGEKLFQACETLSEAVKQLKGIKGQ
jgi:hypothetical protein